jgi:hypothetical protein
MVVELAGDADARDRRVDHQRQALAGVVIDYRQDGHAPPIGHLVMHSTGQDRGRGQLGAMVRDAAAWCRTRLPLAARVPNVFRNEGASQRRQPQHADQRGGRHAGQSRRQYGATRSIARQRNPRVGRPGVSRPASGDPTACAASAGLRQPPLSSPRRGGRGGEAKEPDQVEGCGPKSNTRSGLSSGCSALKVRYRSLNKNDLRARQSIHGAPASVAPPAGIACPH